MLFTTFLIRDSRSINYFFILEIVLSTTSEHYFYVVSKICLVVVSVVCNTFLIKNWTYRWLYSFNKNNDQHWLSVNNTGVCFQTVPRKNKRLL